jgi:competence protein ComEC
VRSVALLPAIALVAGTTCAPLIGAPGAVLLWALPVTVALGVLAWCREEGRGACAAVVLGFFLSGLVLGVSARDLALAPSLRLVLEREVGGFLLDDLGPEHDHDPILARAVLVEDASPRDGFVSLRVRIIALRVGEEWLAVDGAATISVGGTAGVQRLLSWRAQRTIEAPVTFRRPERYLNDGVPDFERDLALGGTSLFGTVKSGLVVDLVATGGPIDEAAASIRAHVRAAVARWVSGHDEVSAAVATAVLIGDRTGLPEETRLALQAAGTYHVIAISGGNIAILAAAACVLMALGAIRGRVAAVLAIGVLLAYAEVVTAGPSVWRATLMAVAYFAARAIDHRTPVWQAMAIAAALVLVLRPLDVRDPGFMLTFGATVALVEGARRAVAVLPRTSVWSWVVASVIGSVAVEVALVPVSASAFSRVTSAGLVLNLLAVPAMGVVQVAAMVVTCVSGVPSVAGPAGWVVHAAATLLVSSAQLVTEAPWLAARVPPPGPMLLLIYYAALGVALVAHGWRRACALVVFVAALGSIATGIDLTRIARVDTAAPSLRLTVFDVGQAESLLLETPERQAILIDSGGVPFGGGIDIGRRVLAPALWARGVRSLDALLVTHGDPDHLGGARAVLEDFRPRRIWEGIRVPPHIPSQGLVDSAQRFRIPIDALRAGRVVIDGRARIRVLHPPEPDWERRRVRNDDSVVIEVLFGDVALVLTGDIGAEVERSIVPLLTPARIRVLKVAHHGSRTSSSSELLDAWRPHIALISCGRGNRFGHPAPEVLRRLKAIGAKVLRTDLDGQITIETDGASLRVRTFKRTNHE